MKTRHLITFGSLLTALVSFSTSAETLPAVHQEYNATLKPSIPLDQGWQNPPRIARTRVWWWWLNGNNTRETITRDLEAMKAAGIGGANVIDAGGDNQDGNRRVPHGPDFGSPEWRELFTHAMREADRLGLEMGFNIQSGWNLGGPTVTVEESSKRVTFSRTLTDGGCDIDLQLPQPPSQAGFYRDVALLAVPMREASPSVSITASSHQPTHEPAKAADANNETFWVSGTHESGQGPRAAKSESLAFRFEHEVRPDRIIITPRPNYGPKSGLIEVLKNNTTPTTLATFTMTATSPSEIKFPATQGNSFRVIIEDAWDPKHPDAPRNVQIAEVAWFSGTKPLLPAAPTINGIRNLDQKAYFNYPGAFTATEAWHLLEASPSEPTCAPDEVIDISRFMDESGKLRWTAPQGRWEVLRFGYTTSGAHVSTHSENGGGYAIDYLDRASLDSYWTKTLEPILADIKPHIGRSLRFLHTDSWELGPVNWTRRMPQEFQRLRGYNIRPFLPVLAGHIIGDSLTTTRFLNDFRRTLADLMAENKYAGFSEKAHALGLGIHPESGGPHAGPMDALRNLGISDIPMGEFWSTSPRHRVADHQRFFVKQTTSAANTYGRRVSLAEAFTNIGRHWQHDPRSLKPTFDQAACEGHNLTMWHTFSASPEDRGIPGDAYFAGEYFNPNVTWWNQGRAFIAYMNRCHFMLQQGVAASDVLHFYGENVPSFVRLKRDDPAKCLPGYDYDVIDARALLERVSVNHNGHLVLPEGTSYRILSLVPHNAVSLPVLNHIATLVEAGATLVGPRPAHSFSLSGGTKADAEFATLCGKLWNDSTRGSKNVGKGRVFWGVTSRDVLQADRVPETFKWSGGDKDTFIDFIQRRTDDTRIFFVANRNNRHENVELQFRVTGFIPEFWDPITGGQRDATDFRETSGRTCIPYPMTPEQAFFVIFRKPSSKTIPQGTPNVPRMRPVMELQGEWQVSFDPKWGGPARTTFPSLIDWTKHEMEGIRHYSGNAIYQKTFTAPASNVPVFLDLGEVESLCEVTLNGQDLGVLWTFPFRTEVTKFLKPGENHLAIKVVNLWANRIIGDAKLPDAQRRTRTNITKLTADIPLEPSGLLGPVTIQAPESDKP